MMNSDINDAFGWVTELLGKWESIVEWPEFMDMVRNIRDFKDISPYLRTIHDVLKKVIDEQDY